MTQSKRKPYGFGSFVKKFTRPIKKIAKSKLGKAALLGGGLYGLGSLAGGGGGWGNFSKLGSMVKGAFSPTGSLAGLIRAKDKATGKYGGVSLGKLGLMGLLGAGTALPFMGGDEEEEIVEEGWENTPASIANITAMARRQDPSLNFLPASNYVQSGFYAADGGLAQLANGGGVAEAQAEQMLKMQYQKYRNQGGTMSYQQFKMQVLKQAQSQGPMAQEHLQMAANGGRIGFYKGSSDYKNYLQDIKDKIISPDTTFNEWLDDNAPDPDYDLVYSQGGRVGLLGGGPVPRSHVAGYTTPPGYNQFDYPTGGVRVGRAEGGLMNLGGMEKDYRQEGGFVPLGKEEKADDVPARLSKNEFVFTADAVRNAGGGDIDAGAEVMENMMNHLEAGGQISEESQGAQGMYDNMRQLETRVA